MPDQLGKNRKHWDNLHMKIQLRLLRAQLIAQRARVTRAAMNPNDVVEKQILQYFYDRNSGATSQRGKKGSAMKIGDSVETEA